MSKNFKHYLETLLLKDIPSLRKYKTKIKIEDDNTKNQKKTTFLINYFYTSIAITIAKDLNVSPFIIAKYLINNISKVLLKHHLTYEITNFGIIKILVPQTFIHNILQHHHQNLSTYIDPKFYKLKSIMIKYHDTDKYILSGNQKGSPTYFHINSKTIKDDINSMKYIRCSIYINCLVKILRLLNNTVIIAADSMPSNYYSEIDILINIILNNKIKRKEVLINTPFNVIPLNIEEVIFIKDHRLITIEELHYPITDEFKYHILKYNIILPITINLNTNENNTILEIRETISIIEYEIFHLKEKLDYDRDFKWLDPYEVNINFLNYSELELDLALELITFIPVIRNITRTYAVHNLINLLERIINKFNNLYNYNINNLYYNKQFNLMLYNNTLNIINQILDLLDIKRIR